MNTVALLQDGSIVHNGKTIESELLLYLSHKVELGEGYTLRSYFQLLERHSVFGELNAFSLTHVEQYRASPESGCTHELCDQLILDKTVEMIGFPGKPRLDIYTRLNGLRCNESIEIKLFQLHNLLDLPFTLGRLKHIVFGDKIDVLDFDTVFNLFEFLDGIAWELSFHGAPENCELRR